MAECYLVKECAQFTARYINGLRKEESNVVDQLDIFSNFLPKIGRSLWRKGNNKTKKTCYDMIDQISWAQAHRYVVFNCGCQEVERYINEHKNLVTGLAKGRWASAHMHSRCFVDWFKERIDLKLQVGEVVSEHVKWLSKGPSFAVKKYNGYYVNGFRFHTMKRDANSFTQNSGVTLTASTHSFSSSKDQNPIVGDVMYYGSLEDIVELSYHGHFSVVLFRCVWFQSEKDHDGLSLVNMKKKLYIEEPFILASQAHQVFYVQDPTKDDCHYAIHNPPTELSNEVHDESAEEDN